MCNWTGWFVFFVSQILTLNFKVSPPVVSESFQKHFRKTFALILKCTFNFFPCLFVLIRIRETIQRTRRDYTVYFLSTQPNRWESEQICVCILLQFLLFWFFLRPFELWRQAKFRSFFFFVLFYGIPFLYLVASSYAKLYCDYVIKILSKKCKEGELHWCRHSLFYLSEICLFWWNTGTSMKEMKYSMHNFSTGFFPVKKLI